VVKWDLDEDTGKLPVPLSLRTATREMPLRRITPTGVSSRIFRQDDPEKPLL